MSAIDVGRRRSHRGPCRPQRANSPSPPQRPRNQLDLPAGLRIFSLPATSRQQWEAEQSEFAVGSNEPTVAEERKSRWASPNRDRRGTRRPTIRGAPKARPAAAIRPARTIEMTAVDISVVMYRVRQHQLPLRGRPGHCIVPERFAMGDRSVGRRQPQEAAWSRTASDDGPNGGHAEGGA